MITLLSGFLLDCVAPVCTVRPEKSLFALPRNFARVTLLHSLTLLIRHSVDFEPCKNRQQLESVFYEIRIQFTSNYCLQATSEKGYIHGNLKRGIESYETAIYLRCLQLRTICRRSW